MEGNYEWLNSDLIVLFCLRTLKAGNQKRHLLAQFKIKKVASSDNQGGKLLEDTICDRLSIQEETPSTRPEIGLSKHIPIR